MKSLNEFKISQEQMKKNIGGMRPIEAAPADPWLPTGDYGTYVDGVKWGTDGYED